MARLHGFGALLIGAWKTKIMQSFYKFASESPILTFFLFAILAECIVQSIKAFRKKKDE